MLCLLTLYESVYWERERLVEYLYRSGSDSLDPDGGALTRLSQNLIRAWEQRIARNRHSAGVSENASRTLAGKK